MPRYTFHLPIGFRLSPRSSYIPFDLLPYAPFQTERSPGVLLGAEFSAEKDTASTTEAAATIVVTTAVGKRVMSHRLISIAQCHSRLQVLGNPPGCSRTQCLRLQPTVKIFRQEDIVDRRWSHWGLGNLPGCSLRRCLHLPTSEEVNRNMLRSGPITKRRRPNERACWLSDTSSCFWSWKPCMR